MWNSHVRTVFSYCHSCAANGSSINHSRYVASSTHRRASESQSDAKEVEVPTLSFSDSSPPFVSDPEPDPSMPSLPLSSSRTRRTRRRRIQGESSSPSRASRRARKHANCASRETARVSSLETELLALVDAAPPSAFIDIASSAFATLARASLRASETSSEKRLCFSLAFRFGFGVSGTGFGTGGGVGSSTRSRSFLCSWSAKVAAEFGEVFSSPRRDVDGFDVAAFFSSAPLCFAGSFFFASPGSKNASSASEGEAFFLGSTGLVPLPLPPAMCASEGTRDARGEAAGDDSGEDASEGGCEEESDAVASTRPFPFSGTSSGRRGVLFLFSSLVFVRARSSSSSSEPDEDANDGGADESSSSMIDGGGGRRSSSSSSSDGASDGGPDEPSSSSATAFGFSSTSVAAESRSRFSDASIAATNASKVRTVSGLALTSANSSNNSARSCSGL